MAGGTSVELLRDIQILFDAGTASGLSDRQLLDRFTNHRDPSAFEVLVSRHGPMVLRVCRNLLADPNDAQDAFQATFLILVRRSGSIRRLDSVGSWLYGVASRVAARVRVGASRRRVAEERAAARVLEAIDPCQGEPDLVEFGPIVQEEVRRLPEKYRSAVILCYWEGLTQEQAAVQLGIPLGTVRSRIARARDLLRRRLTRRGSAPVAGIVSAGMDTAPYLLGRLPQISSGLVHSTVQAASRFAAGQAPVQVVSGSAASLVQRILWSMAMIKFCKLATALSVLVLTIWGVSLWAQQPEARRPRTRPQARPEHTPPIQAKTAPPLQDGPAHTIEPPDLVLVEVLEGLPGRPISGERLVRPDGTISLGFYGEVHVAGLTLLEAKEKIVRHLRKSISDELLGLTEIDPETGEPAIDPKTKKLKRIDPKDTDRVFVDVTAYNSKNYYVEGEVWYPGRLPFTGRESVLDVLHFVGGPAPAADRSGIRLIRSFPAGSPVQVLPIDYEEITMGTDSLTNYQILPGDRLVIPRDPNYVPPESAPVRSQQRAPQAPKLPHDPSRYYFPSSSGDAADKHLETLHSVERHVTELERKLDQIIERMDRAAEKAQTKSSEKPRSRGGSAPVRREENSSEE